MIALELVVYKLKALVLSGIYSSNVLIFFPSENLPVSNVKRFGGKI